MIDIVTWRARIGMYRVYVGPSGRRAKVLRPLLSRDMSLLLAQWLALSTVTLEVVTVIIFLIMLCGDVELNPGPRGENSLGCIVP